jgi:iron complex outermembrane receptor protein
LEEKFNRYLIIPTLNPVHPVLFQYAFDRGNLDPEKIISREIGYLGQVGRLSFDARLYHDSIFNVIRLLPLTSGFTVPPGYTLITSPLGISNGVNAGRATVEGFEMQAKWQITADTHALFNYSGENIRQIVPTKISPPLKKDLENAAPGNTVSALINHKFTNSLDGSIAYYQTSKVEALGDGQPVALIRRVDVRLGSKFYIGNKSCEISGVIENLFDNNYQEFAKYNVAKRRARINFSLDF